jgi:ABC-type branched-subunit amino acid transport system ATPase component
LLLTIEKVCKHFGSRAVLDNVDFTVRESEVLGLIGPNGSGKTTLFECVAGLLPANGGTVCFKDQPLPLASK